jgi:hypothetical protein
MTFYVCSTSDSVRGRGNGNSPRGGRNGFQAPPPPPRDTPKAAYAVEPFGQNLFRERGAKPVDGCFLSFDENKIVVVACVMNDFEERGRVRNGCVLVCEFEAQSGRVNRVDELVPEGFAFKKPSSAAASDDGKFLAIKDDYGVHFFDANTKASTRTKLPITSLLTFLLGLWIPNGKSILLHQSYDNLDP